MIPFKQNKINLTHIHFNNRNVNTAVNSKDNNNKQKIIILIQNYGINNIKK